MIKKILIICFSVFLLVGCSCSMSGTPKKAVEELLNKYKMNDKAVITELDDYVATQSLSDDQKKTYKEILKKQYTDLKYDLTEETVDGDTASVTAKITVYDLYKVQKTAETYLVEHKEEFYDENKVYDKTLFIDYKLDKMKKNTEVVDYTITFTLTKVDNKWTVDQLDDASLEKIHGIYNYEND